MLTLYSALKLFAYDVLITNIIKNIRNLARIKDIDGFLIGGASQNAKKFIDIVKKTII